MRSHKKNCKDFLEEKQNDDACSIYIEKSRNVAHKFQLSTDIVKRKTRVPSRLEGDMLVTECIGRTESCQGVEAFLRIDIYKPVIAKALSEFNRGFSSGKVDVLQAVGAFIPGSETFLNSDVIEPMAKHYKLSIKQTRRI